MVTLSHVEVNLPEMKYLPPNATRHIQIMDVGITTDVKAVSKQLMQTLPLTW